MRTTGSRSLVLYILGLGFLAGLAVFLYGFLFNGGNWAMQPFNKHINTTGQLSNSGKVLDRNGVVLAESKEGKRVYNSDVEIRRSMLHTVGDSNGYISTGVQHSYRAQMSGYSQITGLMNFDENPASGDITLTLDSSLCKLAYEKMGVRKGAMALYNYKTGEILCQVSSPDFDPMDVPKDLETNPKYDGVYVNNVLSSAYTPGSIFKLVTTAAALENLSDPENMYFNCTGSTIINGNKVTCTATHGKVDMKTGLAKSCNIVFAELAVQIGKEKMTEEANLMGFNKSFTVDGIPTAKSVYDVSKAETDGLAWSGVGQDIDTANPYHMLMLMGAIANDGVPVTPYFVKDVAGSFGLAQLTGHGSLGERMVKETTAKRLKTLMRYNVTSDYGDDMFPGMSVCAKTGTGEVGGGKEANGWIVGFSADERTPYAFAVVVEEGGYGRTSAGTIASALMGAAKKLK